MAKQGQHKHDINDPRISKGHNKPKKSQPITTGTYKSPRAYRKQALMHEDSAKQAQLQHNEWHDDTRVSPTADLRVRARHLRGGRSGSDSNASSGTRGY
jgi:hypothetical protein